MIHCCFTISISKVLQNALPHKYAHLSRDDDTQYEVVECQWSTNLKRCQISVLVYISECISLMGVSVGSYSKSQYKIERETKHFSIAVIITTFVVQTPSSRQAMKITRIGFEHVTRTSLVARSTSRLNAATHTLFFCTDILTSRS